MAFAAAVMSTSAGHKAFTRSPSNDEILDSYSPQPATPPRHEPIHRPSIPRSSSNNSNLSTRTPIMNSPDLSYINQFNTSLSSFKPGSPPGIHSNAPNGMPESPHMIRCSTCNSQVPLLELSDHICRPSAPSSSSSSAPLNQPKQASLPSQHARLASGFNQDATASASSKPRPPQPALRNLLNPLKVNVSQAWRQNGQQLEAPLPTPNRTPLPHSPSSASYSPSYQSHTPSPGTSPAAIPNLSPSYPFEKQHRRYPTSELERNQPSPLIAHSPGSDTVDLSAENNAGIGARMPFYEKLQQQRAFVAPASPAPAISPSLSPSGTQKQYTPPPLSARSINPPWNRLNEGQIPKSPITPGWSGLANEEPEIYARFDQTSESVDSHSIEAGDEEEEDDQQEQQEQQKTSSTAGAAKAPHQHTQHSQHHHIRETSDSGESSAALSNSYSDHLDYFINEGSTPDTSPEFPDTPLFKDNDLSASTSLSSSVGHFGLEQERRQNKLDHREEVKEEEEEEEYHGYDDDIIDSYPTPQPGFSGRFGGLVIDDDASDEYHRSQAPSNYQGSQERERQGRLAPSPEPVPVSSPLLRAHSDRAFQDSTHPFTRPLGRGIPASNSTPNNLARLAGIDTSEGKQVSKSSPRKVDESAIPFNGRRRLQSDEISKDQFPLDLGNSETGRQLSSASPTATTPTGEASGLRLDACLDDLLKEMNRESIDTLPATSVAASALRSPLPHGSEDSITPTSPNGSSSRRPFDLKPETLAVTERDVSCDSCNQSIKIGIPVERDGQSFCNECYAQLYLPKCRKCRLPIEDKAIGSGDGKVKGKFHIGCFSCFSCSAPFPTGDFYVFGNRPYCAQHYHERNGTLCANAACSEEQRGIEGPCVSLVGEESGNGGRYHPTCFKCSEGTCDILLDQYHYVLSGLPFCETHAREIEDQDNMPLTSRSASPPREFAADSNDFYDARYGASANTATGPEQRRRSASLDIPVQSLNALRKNAQAPNYRGMLARRKSSGRGRPSESSNGNGWDINGRNQLPTQQPARMANGGYNGGPPPVSRTRRAEKRRTVISQIRM